MDFSILKSIDIINADNLLFLSIFLILAIVVIGIVFFVLSKIIKTIVNLVKSAFNIEEQKPRFSNITSSVQPENKLPPEKKNIIAPGQMPAGSGVIVANKKEELTQIDIKKMAEMKEKEKISEDLNRFKSNASAQKSFSTNVGKPEEKKDLGIKDLNSDYKKYSEMTKGQGAVKTEPDNKNRGVIGIVEDSEQKKADSPVKIKGPGQSSDKTVFQGKEKISMREAVYDIAKKSTSGYNLVGGESFSQKERSEIAKKISGFGRFGTMLQKSERGRIYKTLSKERMRASPSEKMKIDKQIRFLKKVVGK